MTPSDEAANEASSSTTSNEGRRSYEVTGLDDATYRLELFPAENVTVDDNGVVSFQDDNSDNLADDDGNTDARIETGSGTNR